MVKKPVNENMFPGNFKEMKAWWKTLHKALKCLLHITVQSKLTVIPLSNVLCKLLFLLLSLPPLLSTFSLWEFGGNLSAHTASLCILRQKAILELKCKFEVHLYSRRPQSPLMIPSIHLHDLLWHQLHHLELPLIQYSQHQWQGLQSPVSALQHQSERYGNKIYWWCEAQSLRHCATA